MRGTVLIVDDNTRFRVRARRALEADGYFVVGDAADGASALEAVRRHRPDVVLLDVGLPDISGLAVAERLACAPKAPAVVLTSTHDVADFGDRVARCGARGFVPKAGLSGASLAAALGRGGERAVRRESGAPGDLRHVVVEEDARHQLLT